MGHEVEAKCLDCGESFNVSHGGGFFFHLLRCDQCGKNKSVGFDEIKELHIRYIKGLSGPYCIASAVYDKAIQSDSSITSISEAEYNTEIEKYAGECACGGNFLFNAPPRCPQCHSVNILENKEIHTFYD